ncbi:MmgE/PrpD family protein [Nocardioides allogilvus]|uniref:MmgE/PrpD family protein n=1 Tax=Nocardioides allogilvus TaxID=2072017 RepID=UPI000D32150C|nr:MmgE/PrpD family protein [Nocardioides allogilvus]
MTELTSAGDARKARPVAEALAEWALALVPSHEDLALADRALLDTVAVGVTARRHHILRVGASLAEVGRWAAACHVIDFDDLHMPSTAHISTVCIPVALATGGGSAAYLAGAGVMARVGTALGWRHYSSGWHATTTSGALGAAVTAAVALGLDADQTARAIALAVPAAGGVQRAFGTDAKALQIGLAAEAGIRAAEFAQAGASADISAVDAWLRLVGGDLDLLDLDGPAVPGGLAIKIYPACYALQRPISAVRSALDLAGAPLDPATVRRVRVRTPAASVQPLIHHRPQDGLQGKFSLEYAVATAILDDRQGFEAFSDEAVRRPEAQRLVGLVETTLVDQGDSLLSGRVELELHTAGGLIHASLEHPPGSPQRPPTEDELGQKVALCLAGSGVNRSDISWAGGGELLRRTLTGP